MRAGDIYTAVLTFVGKHGPWAAIAIFFGWFMFAELRADVKSMRTEHVQILRILRAMCLNDAGEEVVKIGRCRARSDDF